MEQRLEELKEEQQVLRIKLDEVNLLVQAYENAIAKQQEETKTKKTVEEQL